MDNNKLKKNFFWIPQTAASRKKFLIEKARTFELQETGSSQTIKYQNSTFFYSSSIIPRRYLYLFQDIKRHVSKRLLEIKDVPDLTQIKPFYFNFSTLTLEPGECVTYSQVAQYDINKAYYTAAKNLGYISEEYYQKYINLPKQIRLILIGALATKKIKVLYAAGQKQEPETIEDKNLRAVFKHLVVHVDKVLLEVSQALKDDFLFYWVDGVCTQDTKKAHDIIAYYSNKYKLDFSYEKLKFVEFQQHETLKAIVNTGNKIKEFQNRKIQNKKCLTIQ